MASSVHFKFRSSLTYDTVLFDGHFISVGELKRLIADKKNLDRDASSELVLMDPQTNAEYKNDSDQIRRNSCVLVRRAPAARPRALQALQEPQVPSQPLAQPAPQQLQPLAAAAATEEDEFGGDPFDMQTNQYLEEESRMKNAIAGEARQWNDETQKAAMAARGRGRGGRGGGRGMLGTLPPPTYICHRCGNPGHYIQDCPTNGDPNFDKRRPRMASGIPMTMLGRNPDGSLVLPNGDFGSLVPNQKGFEAVMSILPSVAAEQKATANLGGEEAEPSAPEKAVIAANTQGREDTAPGKELLDSIAVQAVSEAQAAASGVAGGPKPTPLPDDAAQVTDNGSAVIKAERQQTAASLFEDDDLVLPSTKDMSFSLGFGMDGAPPTIKQLTTPGTAIAPEPIQQPAPPAEARPSDAADLHEKEFLSRLPYLQDVLPGGPIVVILKAFKSIRPMPITYDALPLTPAEFEKLQEQHLHLCNGSKSTARYNKVVRSNSRSHVHSAERDRVQNNKIREMQSLERRSVERKHSRSSSPSPVRLSSRSRQDHVGDTSTGDFAKRQATPTATASRLSGQRDAREISNVRNVLIDVVAGASVTQSISLHNAIWQAPPEDQYGSGRGVKGGGNVDGRWESGHHGRTHQAQGGRYSEAHSYGLERDREGIDESAQQDYREASRALSADLLEERYDRPLRRPRRSDSVSVSQEGSDRGQSHMEDYGSPSNHKHKEEKKKRKKKHKEDKKKHKREHKGRERGRASAQRMDGSDSDTSQQYLNQDFRPGKPTDQHNGDTLDRRRSFGDQDWHRSSGGGAEAPKRASHHSQRTSGRDHGFEEQVSDLYRRGSSMQRQEIAHRDSRHSRSTARGGRRIEWNPEQLPTGGALFARAMHDSVADAAAADKSHSRRHRPDGKDDFPEPKRHRSSRHSDDDNRSPGRYVW